MADERIGANTEKITELLEEAVCLYRKDRKIAEDNYNSIKSQLDTVLDDGIYMSEEGKLEKELNNALKLMFEAGKRLDKVLETTVKVMITEMINDNKLQLADKLIEGSGQLQGPIDFKQLTNS